MFKAEATDWLRGDRQQPSGSGQRVFYFGLSVVKFPSGGLERVNAKTAGRSLPGAPKGGFSAVGVCSWGALAGSGGIGEMEILHPLAAAAPIVVLPYRFGGFLYLLTRSFSAYCGGDISPLVAEGQAAVEPRFDSDLLAAHA